METQDKDISKDINKILQAINYIGGILENMDIRLKTIEKRQNELNKQITGIKYKMPDINAQITQNRSVITEINNMLENIDYKLAYGNKAMQFRSIDREIEIAQKKYRSLPTDKNRTRLIDLQKQKLSYYDY